VTLFYKSHILVVGSMLVWSNYYGVSRQGFYCEEVFDAHGTVHR